MESSLVGRIVLGIGVLAAAVALLILLSNSDSGDKGNGSMGTSAQADSRPGDDAQSNKPGEKPAANEPVPTIVVTGGKPVGGVEELTFEAGERIRFAVRSDAADVLHVHGYDVEKEIGPGRVTEFDFPATVEGIFEAELHGSGEQIAELRIEP